MDIFCGGSCWRLGVNGECFIKLLALLKGVNELLSSVSAE